MKSRCIIAAALAAATLLLAQSPENGKTSPRVDRLNGVAGPAGLSSSAGPLLLNYHGGTVMLGQTHIYYIWYGDWSVDANAAPILNVLANNLVGSPYYNILTQYSQTSPAGNVSNSVVLSGSTNSTYVAANPLALTDNDISGIVQAAIGSHSLPLDGNGVYFVLTAPGVAEGSGQSGFLSTYCGWHSAFSLSGTWIQYAFVGDAAGPNLNKCAAQTASSPNNDPPADAMASILVHELAEAVTDPLNNAWYDVNQQEVADNCAFMFGTTFAAPNGSMANVTLGGFDYLIQQEFSNASGSCVMSYPRASTRGIDAPTITDTSGLLSRSVNAALVMNAGAPVMNAGSSSGLPSRVGIFRSGFYWLEDVDGNQQFNQPPDQAFAFGGVPGDIPITGDWNGDGRTKVGVYRPSNGLFILDTNGNQQFDVGDAVYNLGVGKQAGDRPVVGDWNGDGRTKVGLFRQGFFWILDYNGNGTFEQGIDKTYAFGGAAGDVPVVGDWTGSGTSKIGLFRMGFYWILDANGNGVLDNINGAGGDQAFAYGGIAGDVPLVGDWNGNGTSKVGVFRQGFLWVLDANGNHAFDGTGPGQDLAFAFGGISGDVPVVGKWSSIPSSIAASSGTPQTTQINTPFAVPLTATLTNSGSPVGGVLVTFAAPTSGASGTFAGGSTTAMATTNASGVATSPAFTANGTSGSYGVTASAPGVGSPATFSLTNMVSSMSFSPSMTTITIATTQNLTLNLSGPAPPGGLTASLNSNNPGVSTVPLSVTVAAGATSVSVPVTGVAPGSATITANGPNFGSASASVTVSSSQNVSATWYGACWENATIFGYTGNFQAVDFALVTPAPVTVQGTLFFTPNCDASQGMDNMNDFGTLTGSTHMIQGFTHHPDVIPSSAIYWIGPRTADGQCAPGSPCSGCLNYTASTISCSLAP
jgi:hypothetical protein